MSSAPVSARPAPQVQDVYPLSPTQRGMLFHSLYAPGSGVYVVQLVFTLQGALDMPAFVQAWQLLAQRHEVLRTAFAWDQLEAPLQVVGAQGRVPCEDADWRALPSDAQERAFDAWLDEDRTRGFDLRKAPLARVQCFRLADEQHRVVFTHHHILLDGWSLPLLLNDWRAAYLAAQASQAPAWSPAPRYRDHLVWLSRQDAAGATHWWRDLLAGFTTPSTPGFVSATPAAASRSSVGDPATASSPHVEQRRLSADQTQALNALARTARVTLSTLVQAAWALLLARASGTPDVVYGLTRAGRPASNPGAQRTVGLFITTLPVRTSVSPDQPLLAWLADLQTRQLAQQAHEHLPLVEVQRSAEALAAQQSLFDTVVVFENYPVDRLPDDGAANLRLQGARVVEQTHYPLSLFVVGGDTLELKLLVDRDRVSPAAAARTLAQVEHLLASFCGEPQATLGSLDLLGQAERDAMLRRAQGPARPGQRTLAPARIAQRADEQPGAPALHDAEGSLDRATLQSRARVIAHHLHKQRVKPGDRVGVSLSRGRDMVAALLAVWRVGAAYVPMDATYPEARLRHMAEDAGLATLVMHEATQSALNWWTGPRLDLSETSKARPPVTDAGPGHEPATTADAIAYVIYTSGSTGRPKGVPITHRSLINLLDAMGTRLGFQADDRWLAVTTLSFDIAGLEIFLPLISGAPLVLASEAQARDAQQLLALMAQHDITVMQATPATWRLLRQLGWSGRRTLTMLCGGEALDLGLARDLLARGRALWNVYGPTETTIWSGALRLTTELLGAQTTGQAPIGAPLDNTSFHVLGANGQLVPDGVPGELFIGGMGLSPGYHGQPALSAERFVPDPWAAPDIGPALMYRTGDRVRWRDDGTLDYLGRLDQQTKLRGYRIELGDIEAALASHAQVQEAVAVIEGDATEAGARLLAYVTLKPGESPTSNGLHPQLRNHLAERLPPYMVPAAIHALDAWPLTPNGKVDRLALRAPQAAAHTAHAVPATELEQTLLALWRDVLRQPQVGLHDHFFEVGGHSLLVINVQGKLKQLGHDLPLVELFRHPTVASLAHHLGQAQAHAANAGASDSTNHTEATQRATGKDRLRQRQQRLQQASAPTEPTR